MHWYEFCALLNGLGPDSPLGHVIKIRSEDDEDVLKNFTKGQHRIRSEWRKRQASRMSQEQTMDFLEMMKQTFISMAGGGNN